MNNYNRNYNNNNNRQIFRNTRTFNTPRSNNNNNSNTNNRFHNNNNNNNNNYQDNRTNTPQRTRNPTRPGYIPVTDLTAPDTPLSPDSTFDNLLQNLTCPENVRHTFTQRTTGIQPDQINQKLINICIQDVCTKLFNNDEEDETFRKSIPFIEMLIMNIIPFANISFSLLTRTPTDASPFYCPICNNTFNDVITNPLIFGDTFNTDILQSNSNGHLQCFSTDPKVNQPPNRQSDPNTFRRRNHRQLRDWKKSHGNYAEYRAHCQRMDDLPHSILYILSCRLSMPCITSSDINQDNTSMSNTPLITNRANTPHNLPSQALVPHTPRTIPRPTPTTSIPNSPAATSIATTSTAAATTTSTLTTSTTTTDEADTDTTTPPSMQLLTQTSDTQSDDNNNLTNDTTTNTNNEKMTTSDTPPTSNTNSNNTNQTKNTDATSIAHTTTTTITNDENTKTTEQTKTTNRKLNDTFNAIKEANSMTNLTDMQVVIPSRR